MTIYCNKTPHRIGGQVPQAIGAGVNVQANRIYQIDATDPTGFLVEYAAGVDLPLAGIAMTSYDNTDGGDGADGTLIDMLHTEATWQVESLDAQFTAASIGQEVHSLDGTLYNVSISAPTIAGPIGKVIRVINSQKAEIDITGYMYVI